MCKQAWCDAYDFLEETLGREPTEDEIRDYLSGLEAYWYDNIKEMQHEF